MQIIITAYDGQNMLEKRMEVRPRHLQNLATIKGKILCAGGLLDEEGKMKGSVMVIDFDSRECLDEYLKSEPYIMEKVWEKVTVESMNVVVLNGEKELILHGCGQRDEGQQTEKQRKVANFVHEC